MFQVALFSGLVAVLTVVPPIVAQTNYCSLCSDHTMCQYTGTGPTCKPKILSGVSSTEMTTILNVHNTERNNVALGKETRGKPGPQPRAANMMKLVWNAELATIAQRWADQCKFAHDTCRKVATNSVGQNMYISMSTATSTTSNWTAAVVAWINEVTLFNQSLVGSYVFSSATGHYTQVVWANTSMVGCGYTVFKDSTSTMTKKLYVCNYARAGNYLSSPMYLIGTHCTKCPVGKKCSSPYLGLCA